MAERETTMHPELADALRAYELEVLDGTERSQAAAYERLRAVRRNLGGAAMEAAAESQGTEATNGQLAA